MARYNNNSSIVWKVVIAVITVLVMAFFALSIYCAVEGKSYKEVFTGETDEVIEEDPTIDDNQDEEEIVIEDETTGVTAVVSLI